MPVDIFSVRAPETIVTDIAIMAGTPRKINVGENIRAYYFEGYPSNIAWGNPNGAPSTEFNGAPKIIGAEWRDLWPKNGVQNGVQNAEVDSLVAALCADLNGRIGASAGNLTMNPPSEVTVASGGPVPGNWTATGRVIGTDEYGAFSASTSVLAGKFILDFYHFSPVDGGTHQEIGFASDAGLSVQEESIIPIEFPDAIPILETTYDIVVPDKTKEFFIFFNRRVYTEYEFSGYPANTIKEDGVTTWEQPCWYINTSGDNTVSPEAFMFCVQPGGTPPPAPPLNAAGFVFPIPGESSDFYRWSQPPWKTRLPFQNYSFSVPNFRLKGK